MPKNTMNEKINSEDSNPKAGSAEDALLAEQAQKDSSELTAARSEIKRLKETVTALRTELERIDEEYKDKLYVVENDSRDEISRLKKTIVQLRSQLVEDAQR